MKTSIKNLFVATLTVLSMATSAFAATGDKAKTVTVLNDIQHIGKIVVKGNVEVILVQSATESVKVYDNYYAKNALVQQEDGLLRISSFQKETLTVAVYVRNLSEIEAGDDAKIKTMGNVSFLSLAIRLKDNASADLSANTISLYTSVSDRASLKMAGHATEHYAALSAQGKVNMDQFTAESSTINALNPVIVQAKMEKEQINTLPTEDDLIVLGK